MRMLFMMCVGVFFSTSSLFAPLSIPELLIKLKKTSQAIAVVNKEQEDVFYAEPFETLSAALSDLELKETTAYNLVSCYHAVAAILNTLALRPLYMSHWVAFDRLKQDLKKVLKAHGIAYELLVEEDFVGASGLLAVDERGKKKTKKSRFFPRPIRNHVRISVKYLKNRK